MHVRSLYAWEHIVRETFNVPIYCSIIALPIQPIPEIAEDTSESSNYAKEESFDSAKSLLVQGYRVIRTTEQRATSVPSLRVGNCVSLCTLLILYRVMAS